MEDLKVKVKKKNAVNWRQLTDGIREELETEKQVQGKVEQKINVIKKLDNKQLDAEHTFGQSIHTINIAKIEKKRMHCL